MVGEQRHATTKQAKSATHKEEFTTADPTMICQPTNEAEEALTEEVLQNGSLIFRKCEVSS